MRCIAAVLNKPIVERLGDELVAPVGVKAGRDDAVESSTRVSDLNSYTTRYGTHNAFRISRHVEYANMHHLYYMYTYYNIPSFP